MAGAQIRRFVFALAPVSAKPHRAELIARELCRLNGLGQMIRAASAYVLARSLALLLPLASRIVGRWPLALPG
jgi:hypothetical protein